MKHLSSGIPKVAIRMLLKLFPASRSRRYMRAIQCYEKYAQELISRHGMPFACKMLKEVFGRAKRVAFGYRDGFLEYPMWQRTDHLGLPRKLYRLSSFLENTWTNKVFALSVFSIFLFLRTRPVWDLSTIVDPFTGRGRTQSLFRFIAGPGIRWIRSLGVNLRLRFPKDLVLLRGGPWTLTALVGSMLDAYALIYFLHRGYPEARAVFSLYDHITESKDILLSRVGKLAKKIGPYDKGVRAPMRLGLMSVSSDRGGKTRTWTAFSYWIQLVLYPIHDLFMSILRAIPEDFTYDQTRSRDWLIAVQRSGSNVYSFDLTAATDRFPLFVQAAVLRKVCGPKVSQWWTTIMRSPLLVAKVPRKGTLIREFVRFSVGQPMGAYSSWPVFALTHHLVVRWAFWKAGVKPDKLYAVLGDDVSIAHPVAASFYRRLMTVDLGVAISEAKSYIPEPGVVPGEFAKQLFSRGKDITPLTPDLLESAASHTWSLIPEVVSHAINRWSFKVGPGFTDLPRICSVLAYHYSDALRFSLFPSHPYHIPEVHRTSWVKVAMRSGRPIIWFPKGTEYLTQPGLFRSAWQQLYHERSRQAVNRLIDRNPYLAGFTRSDLAPSLSVSSDKELTEFMDRKGLHHPLARVSVRTYWKFVRLMSTAIKDAGKTLPGPFGPVPSNLADLEITIRVLDAALDRGYRPWQPNPLIKTAVAAKVMRSYLTYFSKLKKFHLFMLRKVGRL